MKKDFPPLNIEIPETVKREADRLAEDPDAILLQAKGETEASPNPLSIAVISHTMTAIRDKGSEIFRQCNRVLLHPAGQLGELREKCKEKGQLFAYLWPG